MARPNRQEQGPHPTCNVTAVRSTLIHEAPSYFAKMIVDVATTDRFKTADGSVIEVPQKSVKPTTPEANFPPTNGSRSWLGHISDVVMANVFWQRQSVDTYGQQVPKGSIKYVEIGAQYNGDRIYKYDGNNIAYELRDRGQNVLARSPELTPSNLGAVLGQITGKKKIALFRIRMFILKLQMGLPQWLIRPISKKN